MASQGCFFRFLGTVKKYLAYTIGEIELSPLLSGDSFGSGPDRNGIHLDKVFVLSECRG